MNCVPALLSMCAGSHEVGVFERWEVMGDSFFVFAPLLFFVFYKRLPRACRTIETSMVRVAVATATPCDDGDVA